MVQIMSIDGWLSYKMNLLIHTVVMLVFVLMEQPVRQREACQSSEAASLVRTKLAPDLSHALGSICLSPVSISCIAQRAPH